MAVVMSVVLLGTTAALALLAPAFELDELPSDGLGAAGTAVWALAVCFSAVSFPTGRPPGSRGAAIAAGAACTAGSHVLYGLAGPLPSLGDLRWLSPWFWFLDVDALASGFTGRLWLQAVLLPVAAGSVTVAGGLWRLRRRDLG